MRKLFFLLSSMNVGGVEKAFLGLLSTLPMQENEVHLGLFQKRGGLIGSVPSWVHIHEVTVYQPYWRLINDPPLWHIKKQIKSFHWLDAFIHILLYTHFKLTGSRYWFYQWLLRNEPMMEGEYDIAVAFAGPRQAIDYYIYKKVQAREKYGWIHFDVSKFGIDRGMTARIYRHYQKIFVVSETAKQIFDNVFPQFKDKTEVRYNIIPKEQICQLADEGNTFSDEFHGKRILTVGRISKEKGQRMAIGALKILISKGYDVKWYFIGEGNDLDYCQKLTYKLGLGDVAVFLGLQINPYGFMRDCDLYVQPSLHEGYCITLAEVRSFEHPIVTTNFAGAKEQLKGRSNYFVTKKISAEDLALGVVRFL